MKMPPFPFLLTCLVSTFLLLGVQGRSTEAEMEEYREIQRLKKLERIAKWSFYVDAASAPSSGAELEELVNGYSFLKAVANETDASYSSEALVLRDQIRETLFSHPDHAKHFLDKVLIIEKQLEEGEISLVNALGPLSRNFNSLKKMPTRETVVCLTSLLDDQRGWPHFRGQGRKATYFPGQSAGDGQPEGSIAGRAVDALCALEILEDPVLERHQKDSEAPAYGMGYEGDYFVPLWRDWWQEVVNGQRTFSFRGDPRRYNHLGEVGPNWKPSRPTLDSTPSATALGKIPSQTPSLQPGAQPAKKAPTPAYWLALILVLLAVVSVVLVRRGQRLP